MTRRPICIHGHFYQPPREDPWLGAVLPEGSAAPGRDWNQRITTESYAPLARARLLDGEGRIKEILNTYEYLSYNFGPTLLTWLQHADPATYEMILAADRASRDRLGFGNAMAQIRHHAIMPLATEDEKRIETAWAVMDFEARYGRLPDGLWLPEAAADTASLEALAEAGIAYTVLAPRQAAAVADPGGDWVPVDEGNLDITMPYRCELPSGRSIAIFFYHGGLSQAIAFERMLENGETFFLRLKESTGPGLLSLATDGETYGHHFKFGEMALAYCIDRAREDDELELTNFAAYLASTPPTRLVQLREPSSWSCAHGVERWKADCGCKTGDHPEWNQGWRGPLRDALSGLKTGLDSYYTERGASVFNDSATALADYGRVLAGGEEAEAFAARHLPPNLDEAGVRTAWNLLAMQRHALASLASCAWFFDDLDRIEPLNAMANALRAIELADAAGHPDGAAALEERFANALSAARSNRTPRHPEGRGGDALLHEEAMPRRGTPESLVLHALLLGWAMADPDDALAEIIQEWPGATVTCTFSDSGGEDAFTGQAAIIFPLGEEPVDSPFTWEPPDNGDPSASRLRLGDGPWLTARDLPWNKRQDILMAWAETRSEARREVLNWDAAEARAMILPLSESQAAQNQTRHWLDLLPALAFQWTLEHADTPEDKALEAILRQLEWCPVSREAFSAEINAHAARLLEHSLPEWGALEQIITNVQALEAPVDWWPTQNLFCTLRDHSPECRRVARLLNFADS